MTKENYYKYLFQFSAFFNWVIAASFLIAEKQIKEMIGMSPSQDQLSWHLTLAFVIIFGVGYYWVSTDLFQNKNIVKLGILGKLSVFIFSSFYFIKGEIPLSGLIFVIPDLIFSLLFIEFILKINKVNINKSHSQRFK